MIFTINGVLGILGFLGSNKFLAPEKRTEDAQTVAGAFPTGLGGIGYLMGL